VILRIGRGHVKPGTWDAFEEIYGRLSANPPRGISQRWLVRDVDDENGGFTLGLWESDEAVAEWLNSSAFAEIQEEMRPYFVGDYQVHTCEVRLHDVVGPT
jgi:heme-degrading monooxygenase HmoA